MIFFLVLLNLLGYPPETRDFRSSLRDLGSPPETRENFRVPLRDQDSPQRPGNFSHQRPVYPSETKVPLRDQGIFQGTPQRPGYPPETREIFHIQNPKKITHKIFPRNIPPTKETSGKDPHPNTPTTPCNPPHGTDLL